MLEILNKKMVTTRKEHACHHCTAVIRKGTSAVAASAQEDEKRIRLHFHPECSARHARAMRTANLDRICGPMSHI